MDITVNQQNYSVADACSLQRMVTDVLQQPAKGIALAVNQQIVPKTGWEQYQLQPGDNVIIIKATQGG